MPIYSQIKIKTKSAKYPIIIGNDIFADELDQILLKYKDVQVAIITDSNLKKKYAKQLSSFKQENFHLFAFPAGEKQKNIDTKIAIEKFLFQNNFDRNSVLIALGGGVVGDIVGYVASTFLRGIKYYQIPTSVISVVDSSVGGKTGINNQFGKNLIGAFYHPQKVVIDIDFLKTLPQDEYLSGLAEVLKYAFIDSRQFYFYLRKNKEIILNRDPVALFHLIKTSVLIKSKVVGKDEKEGGYRRILNFGHTVGHALENLSHYQLKHGYGVSIGMAAEAYMSMHLDYLSEKEYLDIIDLIKSYGLPHFIEPVHKPADIYKVMLNDKKSYGGTIYINLLQTIGKVHPNNKKFTVPINQQQTMIFLKELKKRK